MASLYINCKCHSLYCISSGYGRLCQTSMTNNAINIRMFRNFCHHSLQWRHNGLDGVSNHQPHHCLLSRYSGPDQRKHQSSASLAFVWGIHRGPMNSPHKWSVTREMFPLDDVIMHTLTLGDVAVILKVLTSNSSYKIVAWPLCGIALRRLSLILTIEKSTLFR